MMYKFWGKVRKHNQRGKKLGFPTANVNLAKNIPEGIYIAKTKLEGKIYPSVTFIGKVKTFNEQKFQAETYILDFDKNIYGKWISIKLLKKIRENKKFNSAKDLITQMKKDKQVARGYFKICQWFQSDYLMVMDKLQKLRWLDKLRIRHFHPESTK